MKTWNDYKEHVKNVDPDLSKDIHETEEIAAVVSAEYSTPPEPLCPVLRATHSVERAIFLFR